MPNRSFQVVDSSGNAHDVTIDASETVRAVKHRILGTPSRNGPAYLIEDSRGNLVDDRLTVAQAMIVDAQILFLRRQPQRLPRFLSRKQSELTAVAADTDPSIPVELGQVVYDRVLPFYLMVDTSVSMTHSMPTINAEIERLWNEVRATPDLRDVCYMSTLTFGETAQVHLPLCAITTRDSHPPSGLVASGKTTNFEDGFRLAAKRISKDCSNLHKPYRPVIYFFSDGVANRGNTTAGLSELLSRSTYERPLQPNIVAFGFGEADESAIGGIQTRGGYMQESPAANLGSALSWLLSSLISSLRNAPGDDAAPVEEVADIFALPRVEAEGWRKIGKVG